MSDQRVSKKLILMLIFLQTTDTLPLYVSQAKDLDILAKHVILIYDLVYEMLIIPVLYSGICVKDHYKSDLSASTFFASLVLCVMYTFWRVPKSTEV